VQRAEQKVVNLALQGGGSQLSPGACSTALLEEETLHFEGISGTSAGGESSSTMKWEYRPFPVLIEPIKS